MQILIVNSNKTSTQYRPDIDGLRAIAVLSVIFFHIGFSGFKGGFIGVDIFFVISGFLITRLLKVEFDRTGDINFRKFYARRFRRLFPALFISLCFSFFAAYFLLEPHLFSDFSGSVVAALFSVSNIYFWTSTGYFDPLAVFKPALHTWSLSVEEQFYFFWPLTLYLIFRLKKQWTLLFIVLSGSLSLACNIAVLSLPTIGKYFGSDSQIQTSALFYLTPFRCFEFAIGASLVWLERLNFHQVLKEICMVLGLIILSWSVLTYTEDMVFPSVSALPPCIGAALVILGGEAKYFGSVLRHKISVAVGLLSYSLYLVHWPVIVVINLVSDAAITTTQRVIGLFLIALLSFVLYRFVESPFRRGWKKIFDTSFLPYAASLSIFICLLGGALHSWINQGWIWRYPENLAGELTDERVNNLNSFVHARKDALNYDFTSGAARKVLVIGDSMTGDLVNALHAGAGEFIDVRTFPMPHPCLPLPSIDPDGLKAIIPKYHQMCRQKIDELRNDSRVREADHIILAVLWPAGVENYLGEAIDYFKKQGAPQLTVVGLKTISVHGRQYISRNFWRARSSFGGVDVPPSEDASKLNQKLKKIVEKKGARFIDMQSLLCTDFKCAVFSASGKLLYFDSDHLTPEGAEYYGSRMVQILHPD